MSGKFVRMRVPSRAEVLDDFTQQPTFPFCILEFEETDNIESPIIKIKVKKELFKKITEEYGGKKIIVYCDLTKGLPTKFGLFSPEMQKSVALLRDLGLISDENTWIKNSIKDIEKYLSKTIEECLNEEERI